MLCRKEPTNQPTLGHSFIHSFIQKTGAAKEPEARAQRMETPSSRVAPPSGHPDTKTAGTHTKRLAHGAGTATTAQAAKHASRQIKTPCTFRVREGTGQRAPRARRSARTPPSACGRRCAQDLVPPVPETRGRGGRTPAARPQPATRPRPARRHTPAPRRPSRGSGKYGLGASAARKGACRGGRPLRPRP